MPRADLGTIQHQVWDLITAPEGVVKGAEELAARGRIESTDLSFLVYGDKRLAAEERLDIYANMYFYRLRDCLAEDFPKVAAVAGGARFHNLVTDYLLAHPSSSWTLRHLGERLPGFIGGHAIGAEMPFLADLARLEWARIDVFDARDVVPLSRDELASMQEDGVAGRRLGLVPAARLLDLEWSIAPVWRQVGEDSGEEAKRDAHSAAVGGDVCEHFEPPLPVSIPARGPAHIVVWRAGFQVFHRTIPADEQACLREVRDRGATLAKLCEMVLASSPERASADAARGMAGLVASWLRDGLLIDLEPSLP